MLCIFLRNNATNKELKKYSQLELQIKKKKKCEFKLAIINVLN